MSIKTNFSQGGSYNAVDLQNQFASMCIDGVINVAGGNLAVTISGTSLMLTIAAGSCFRNGLYLNNSSIITNNPAYAVAGNSSGFNRIDVVYADLDNNAISILTGVPSASPTAPLLTNNTLALAQVTVGNNVSSLTAGSIVDVRLSMQPSSSVSIRTSNGTGAGLAPNPYSGYILFAQDRGGPNFLIAMGYKTSNASAPIFQTFTTATLSLGAANSIGTQVINGGTTANVSCYCICLQT